jgi:hypothetical protein
MAVDDGSPLSSSTTKTMIGRSLGNRILRDDQRTFDDLIQLGTHRQAVLLREERAGTRVQSAVDGGPEQSVPQSIHG